MAIIDEIGTALWLSFQKLFESISEYVPIVLGAILIILTGWIIGKITKYFVTKLLQTTRLDEWVEEQNLSAAIGDYRLSVLCGSFIKWYIFAIFFIQAVHLFNVKLAGNFLETIAYYFPQLILAVAIFVTGLLIARYIRNTVELTSYKYKNVIALSIEIFIIYIVLVVALSTIKGLDVTILLDLFKIVIAAIALTVALILGISFGFAFREEATKMIKELKKNQKSI